MSEYNRDPEVIRERIAEMREEVINRLAMQECEEVFYRMSTADKSMMRDAIAAYAEDITDEELERREYGAMWPYVAKYIYEILREEIERDYYYE